MAALVERIETEAGPIVLAVFNAGTYLPTIGDGRRRRTSSRPTRSTCSASVNGLVPLVERMRERGARPDRFRSVGDRLFRQAVDGRLRRHPRRRSTTWLKR